MSFADLGESSQHGPRKGVCVQERSEEPRTRELDGAGFQGITRVGQMVLTRLIESADLALTLFRPAGWEESLTKEQW